MERARPRGAIPRSVRAAAAAVGVGALLAGAAPATTARPHWRANVRAAAAYAGGRHAAAIAFAVCTPRGCAGRATRTRFFSASLIKPMLLVGYLDRRGVRGRPLRRSERALLGPMIRRSDNDAATRVLARVGTGGLRAVARRAGMRRFTPVRSPWGESRIDALDQARFFLRIDRLVARRHRRYAMGLLRRIVPAQRWGVARVAPRGWRLYFKGGWGSGNGWVDHQSALLVRGRRRVALSILTSLDGSHGAGKQTLRGIAARLLRDL